MARRFLAAAFTVILGCSLQCLAQTGALTPAVLFSNDGRYYALFANDTRQDYEGAIATCAALRLGPSQDLPAALQPVAVMAEKFQRLFITSQDVALALVEAVRAGTLAAGADYIFWDVWGWDEYRVCRGALHTEEQGYPVFVTSDRPCDWRFGFVCMEESEVLELGFSSSSAWYRSIQQAATSRSTYKLGPGASGLAFVSSDLVVGNPSPPSGRTVPFNDSDAFWSLGPVVSAFYRGGDKKLLALRLLREAEVGAAWSMYGTNSVDQVIGPSNTSLVLPYASPFELYNVGANYSEYIVTVQGCYRSHLVEMLFFVTRSGRQYQLGRGGCTNRFREDAPPGGYLAGLAGAYMNGSLFDLKNPPTYPTGPDSAWIDQLRFVWVAPVGAGTPTYTLFPAPVLTAQGAAPAFCPTAQPMATPFAEGWPLECGSRTGVCPSNTCCGGSVSVTATSTIYRTCSTTVTACQASCVSGYGVCGSVPSSRDVQFVRSPPGKEGTPDTTVYNIHLDAQTDYASALKYCRTSTFMGLSWSMITDQDVLGWTTSLDMRQGAYAAITDGRYFWVETDANYVAAAPSFACVRASFGGQIVVEYLPIGPGDRFLHAYAISDCGSSGSIMCRASAAQDTSTFGKQNGPVSWVPGFHALTTSTSLGSGPYGTGSCSFSMGVGSANIRAGGVVVADAITAVSISMVTILSNDSDSVAVLSGLRVRLGSGQVTTAGNAGSDGWHTLELASGESITAVSGCWGGFVERLVLHTSAGRLWTPPFWVSSSCSVPFMEVAPAGGYLVGLQGSAGTYLEAAQLVWGQPIAGPPPTANPPPPPTADPPPAPSPPLPPPAVIATDGGGVVAIPSASSGGSGDELSTGAVVGIVVGVSVGAVLIILLLVLLLWRRRRDAREPSGPPTPIVYIASAGKDDSQLQPSASGAKSGSAESKLVDVEHGTTPGTSSIVSSVAKTGTTCAVTATTTSSNTLTASTPGGGSQQEVAACRTVTSYMMGVEDKLSAYIRAGAGSMEARAGTELALDDATTPTAPSEKVDIATAIAKLQAELSGRQEQLHITSVLGKGSFGVVYLGTWRGLRVAVKTLVVHDALLGKEGRQRHRAIMEAAISKSLQHPNVVSTYASELVPLTAVDAATPAATSGPGSFAEGSGVSQPSSTPDVYKLFIIQELCDVGSLTAALAAGVVGSVAAGGAAALCALTLALDIACGMSHIHSKSIVHGDLSSSNVLLSSCSRGPDGHPEPLANSASEDMALRRPLDSAWRPPVIAKVADFGLSVHMGDNQTHASNHYQGTPAYAAPEVAQRGRLSKAADVWAYGVILLELCHGEDITRLSEAQGVQGGAAVGEAPSLPAVPPTCPPALKAIVAGCLAPEPAARPAFTEIVGALVGLLTQAHQAMEQEPNGAPA